MRIAPLPVGPDEDVDPPFDPETRARNLARRFPGVRAVDFVRVLLVPEERSGTCWTEFSRPWETRIELRSVIGGESQAASGIAALKSAGWWPLYRAPEGFGFERRARFESLDLEVGSRFACRCVNRPVEGEDAWRSVDVRFRWKAGGMPEVSGTVGSADSTRALPPTSVYGHFLTWQFPARIDAGEGKRDRCGLSVTVSILNDPPIL